MAHPKEPAFQESLSPEEMQGWLEQEIRDSAKAHELRTKEATEFVTAYIAGRITPDQAMRCMVDYDRRWGEALFGTSAFPKMSDANILREIDKARDEMYGKHSKKFLENLSPDKNPSR